MSLKPISEFENYVLDSESLQVINIKRGKPLKVQRGSTGYPEVQLWKNNRGYHKPMHRIVAEACIPNPDNLPYVNHKDEDITNYNVENLEWCTPSYNQTHGSANDSRGEKISKATRGIPKPWVAEQKSIPVIATDSLGNETRYSSARDAARKLNLDQSTITAVTNGRRISTGGYRFRKEQ